MEHIQGMTLYNYLKTHADDVHSRKAGGKYMYSAGGGGKIPAETLYSYGQPRPKLARKLLEKQQNGNTTNT